MSGISIQNNVFVFDDYNSNKKVLLECNDYLNNKSRMPMHTISNSETIVSFLVALVENYRKIFNCNFDEETLAYLVMDCLITKKLVSSAVPIKVLEMGCENGRFSYHITEILGKINPESTLCFLSEEINNEGNNKWLNSAILASKTPNLSMIVSEYHKTNLASNNFDIVIINGTVKYKNLYKSIKEAERLVKNGGILLCCSTNSFFNSALKLAFQDIDEYLISDSQSVVKVEYKGTSWSTKEDENYYNELLEVFEKLKEVFSSFPDLEICRKYIEILNKYINYSIEKNDIQLKLYLIQLNENIMDYMVHIEDEFKEYYHREIGRLIFEYNEKIYKPKCL